MYRQLVKIHAITAAQLAECAHWRQTDSTPRSIRAGMSRPRPSAVPSVTRLTPSPSVDFSSQAPPWPWQGWRDEPQARCQPHLGSLSALPSRYEQSSWQGRQSNFFESTFEEPRDVATHYEAAMHCPTQASREATPSSDKEASSNDAAHHTRDGIRSGNKWRPLGTVTMASHDKDHSWEAGNSGMGRISATTRSGSHSTRTPTDYF
jgi:hypothetical protein